jgi:hypothetical protein
MHTLRSGMDLTYHSYPTTTNLNLIKTLLDGVNHIPMHIPWPNFRWALRDLGVVACETKRLGAHDQMRSVLHITHSTPPPQI